MTKFDPNRTYYYHDLLRSTENVLEMWDFMAREPNAPEDEEGKKELEEFNRGHYGVWTDEDGEEYVITDIAMQHMCELHAFIQQQRKDHDSERRRTQGEINDLTRKLKRAREYAAMSDERIADELQYEIDYYEKEAGEEGLVYGPVELMGYCRDRLRNTRIKK